MNKLALEALEHVGIKEQANKKQISFQVVKGRELQ